jgi:hypothetical protein
LNVQAFSKQSTHFFSDLSPENNKDKPFAFSASRAERVVNSLWLYGFYGFGDQGFMIVGDEAG